LIFAMIFSMIFGHHPIQSSSDTTVVIRYNHGDLANRAGLQQAELVTKLFHHGFDRGAEEWVRKR